MRGANIIFIALKYFLKYKANKHCRYSHNSSKKGDRLLLDLTIKDDSVKRSVEIFNHYRDKTNSNEKWKNIILQ